MKIYAQALGLQVNNRKDKETVLNNESTKKRA